MMILSRHVVAVLLATVLSIGSVSAANIVILNNDAAGEGFNDPTSVAPVGGNSGTTLGQQRLNVFANAAAAWGALLSSNVTINVQSNFDPLTCTSSQAVLGSAGTATIHRNFSNAPYSNTYYPAALASSLANADLNGNTAEIKITFNSSVDNNNNCLNNTNWYYGVDGNKPANTIDLRTVVLHELAHGLGFATFVDVTTGKKFGTGNGNNDAFMLNLHDHSLNLPWSSMTNAQRAASATDTGDLHWIGSQVTANSGGLTAGKSGGHVRMYAPSTLAPGSSVSHFDTALAPNELMEPIITGTQTNPGLAVLLMQDIGWTLLNTAPAISAISNKTTNEDTASGLISFTVSDQQMAAGSLVVTASSSNTDIVQNSGLVLGGSGANRNLTITPVSNANGVVTITVTVSDGSSSTDSAFQLTVNAVNDPPVIAVTNPVDAAVFGETANIAFSATATDVEDGNIAANVQWSSDRDGGLGAGSNLVRNLSLGAHVITASITDSVNSTITDQISVTINPDWDLDGDGMADAWEQANFGTLARDGTGDFDNDGILDLQEYQNSLVTHDGDVNGDGQVNAGDLLLAWRHVLGLSLLSQPQIDRGDLYPPGAADGVLNMSDLILLQKMLLNQ